MSLDATIRAAVNKAFLAAGDLVRVGTLSKRTVSDYNLATGAVVSTASTLTVDVILQTSQNSQGVFDTTIMMKSGVDMSMYDTIVISSKTYNIVDYGDDEYVITAKIERVV